jgi:Skp family chaperone for outer membrane proteins
MLFLPAAALLLLAGSLYSQQDRDVKRQEVKVGVVDLQGVTMKFDKWLRLAKKLEDESKASSDKMEKMEAEGAALQESLKQYEPGSPKHTETQIEISKRQIELKTFFENEQKRLKEMAEKLGGELVDNIEEVVKEYGRQNSFTLIIKKEETQPQGRNWDELRSYVVRKTVMFYDPNIDITGEIIKILNERFK